MRRKVNNSEIHEIKRYYEVPSEKVQEWTDTIENLIKQRNQYKAENEKLRERNKKLEKRNNQKVRRYVRGGLQQMKIEDLESKYNGMIAERNSLIDDLSWYKAKVSRLEQRISKLVSENTKLQNDLFSEQLIQDEADDKIKKLERHNKDLRLQSDTYFEQWQEVKKELQDYEDDYEMVTNNCIYWEDKAHWLEDESSKYINLLSEISQHIGNKPSSSTYKYFRAKLDGIGIKVGE